MLQLKNETPFPASIFLLPDTDGVDALITVIKGTFTLGEQPTVADGQVPIALADEYTGDPGASSISVPSDVGLAKPATDVLLLGHAHAPGGRPATWMDVSLSLGPLQKAVRVFGDRVWQSDGVGHSISEPRPFDSMPLVWERAFGGTDRVGSQPSAEVRNPVGAGFRASDGEKEVHGLGLPNLEDPGEPITSWKQNPPPACFAPVAAHWEPRRSFAGTYDERWEREHAPYLPEDFDSRFFQVAPPGLVAPGYLRGGEPGEIRGATTSGVLRFRLPSLRLQVSHLVDGVREDATANLDTVLIEPDAGRLVIVWRSLLRCDKRALRVRGIEVQALEVAA